MARTPPRGVVWLAGLAFVFGAFRAVFGAGSLLDASALSGVATGLANVAVGVLWIVVAGGLAWTTWWGWTLAVGLTALDLAGMGALVLLAPPAILFLLVPATVDLAVLSYLVANRRHFRRRPVPGDPLPTERTAQFESVRDGRFE